MNKNAIGLLLLRIGLGGVFLWFGIDKLFHPAVWVNYIPPWFPVLIGKMAFIYLHGIVETLVGLLLLAGWFTRIAAAIAAVQMVPIIFSLGYNEIGVRDFGLLALALGLAFLGPGEWSIDKKRGGKI